MMARSISGWSDGASEVTEAAAEAAAAAAFKRQGTPSSQSILGPPLGAGVSRSSSRGAARLSSGRPSSTAVTGSGCPDSPQRCGTPLSPNVSQRASTPQTLDSPAGTRVTSVRPDGARAATPQQRAGTPGRSISGRASTPQLHLGAGGGAAAAAAAGSGSTSSSHGSRGGPGEGPGSSAVGEGGRSQGVSQANLGAGWADNSGPSAGPVQAAGAVTPGSQWWLRWGRVCVCVCVRE